MLTYFSYKAFIKEEMIMGKEYEFCKKYIWDEGENVSNLVLGQL